MNHPDVKKLYKFYSVTNHHLDALSAPAFHFSAPSSFNDPLDCFIEVDRKIPLAHYKKELERHGKKIGIPRKRIEKAKRYAYRFADENGLIPTTVFSDIEDMIVGLENRIHEESGVCCFSMKIDEPLMWCHYASGLRGFVIEFRRDPGGFFDGDSSFPVDYVPKKIRNMSPLSVIDRNISTEDHVREIVSKKHQHWAYEKEWRCLHSHAGKLIPFPKNIVNRLVVGGRMSDELQSHLLTKVPWLKDIPLAEASLNDYGQIEINEK